MSSTANVRRGAPARPALTQPVLTTGETASHARVRAPRPWVASLQRPAAKILVAGGLTLAGWLLGAALSGSTASAAGEPRCPEAPAVSTVDHAAKPVLHERHRKSHHETGAAKCAERPKIDNAEDETQQQADEPPAASGTTKDGKDTSATEDPETTSSGGNLLGGLVSGTLDTVSGATGTTKDTSATPEPAKVASSDSSPTEAPKATSSSGNLLGGLVSGTLDTVSGATGTTKDTSAAEASTKATSAGGDLLGGLVGGVFDVVGGTLATVTGTLDVVTDTLSHTVLAPLTQPSAGYPGAPALLPLDDILGPVLSGGSNSGGVTAVVLGVPAVVTQVPATVAETVPVAVSDAAQQQQQTTRIPVAHLVVRHTQPLPVVQDQPRDSGTHARNGGGGDSTPGLPGGTTAPSAPAPTAAPGHDGSGGARNAFAVHTDDVTTTQLKLIGTSRDHEVDGAGREAALPTTSPD
ncbi:hypothetical protein AB0M80_03995 [Amycolatopsis sp. NPDC051045]|uniref:hypothetical protein n=1 Tax=Amycolatopsis sp. NPDC051045 TaxID=3156922 RepID=UPI00342C8B55